MSPDADATAVAASAGAGGGDGGAGAGASSSPASAAANGRALVRWDQILPRRSLRVLLVEHDDSTRQVVTALLRKCGYRGESFASSSSSPPCFFPTPPVVNPHGKFSLVLTPLSLPLSLPLGDGRQWRRSRTG
jgi:hypothetical protein